ncbi:MAG: oxidoreductase, partial [Bacteroidales bacterium]|nr:oxidoreductase [Bacteroidales bacterium]
IILDPPAYGHGPGGEKWKLDELLFGLLKYVAALLSPREGFVVLNLYSNGYSALLGETLMQQAFKGQAGAIESGELVLEDGFGKKLPLSIYVRLKR